MGKSASEALQRIDAGCLADIFEDRPGRVQHPVVQCVQIKPIAAQPGGQERHRVIFSDTKNYIQTMLAVHQNSLVDQKILRRGVLVQLVGYSANRVKGKRILIVTDIKVLEDYGEHDKLGDPKPLELKTEEEEKPAPNTITSNGFYGNKQEQPKQNRSMPSHTKPSSSSAHANIYPIEAISPYSNKWTIKARCTSKSEIKTWHNRNGEGKLFSVNLLDESGEIRATGFNDQCDQLYDVFQEGQVYYISSPCRVTFAKKQFSNLANDYELHFERDTVVEKAEEQDGVPQVRYNFTNIADLQSVEKDTTIDIIAILKDVGEVGQATSKTTGKPYEKRELTLVDNTGYSVRMTIWGKTAASLDVQPGSVVVFKGVKVSDFGGRSLSLLSSGSMTANPDMPEAHKLKGWWESHDRPGNFSTHENVQGAVSGVGSRSDPFKTISQVKEEQLGMSEKPDFFSIKATVHYIKQEPFAYPACLSEGCNRKVVEIDPGQWRCEKCDTTHPKPEYRYIISANVSDHTGQLWVNCFDDTGRLLLGRTADELMAIKDEDQKQVEEIFSEANYKTWNWKCKARLDNFQEQQR
ncbi:Replication factor A protein 1 [Exophiala dermatitidis]|nr:Replication factor A protein 1 [Exophiala dermatitidis]KAJ4519644.1 Replication factor A protein 1 [Exophiala dermatitidis]KAJ4534556.1 Replication factor A protein 1 [Exophiala dermatitidis]KAJ4573471.1 Replication factor A protein 1 [Exophiala dermatitidis]KAJ4595437.1 Replication factor A protein 1 [Exophiala dermatitidis]